MPNAGIKRWILFGLPALVAVLAGLTAAVPSWREAVQKGFSRQSREVLATAEGDLLNDGTTTKIIKYQNAEGLFVEIVKPSSTGTTQLIDRILLPDKHDGLFNFQGHVTRLAVADIDNDGKMELIAPTFDNQLVPHLNVFRYNPALGRFELYQPRK